MPTPIRVLSFDRRVDLRRTVRADDVNEAAFAKKIACHAGLDPASIGARRHGSWVKPGMTVGRSHWHSQMAGLFQLSCGFQLEGRMPRSAIKAGRVIDRVVYGRYRQEATE